MAISGADAAQQIDNVFFSIRGSEPKVKMGFATTLCFEGGHTPERRKHSLDVMDDYIAMTPEINHVQAPRARSVRPIGQTDVRALYDTEADTLADVSSGGAAIYSLAGPQESGFASHHGLIATWSDRYSRWSNIVAMQAATTVHDRGGLDGYVENVLRWCDLLQPAHGTAGLSLLPFFGGDVSGQCRLCYPVLARHPGLDWPDIGYWIVGLNQSDADYVRTVNWLTVLNNSFVDILGGINAISDHLSHECTIHRWSDGVVIQAGPEPLVGDANAGDLLPNYRAVDAALRPLIFQDFQSRFGFITAPAPTDPAEASRMWVNRFHPAI